MQFCYLITAFPATIIIIMTKNNQGDIKNAGLNYLYNYSKLT